MIRQWEILHHPCERDLQRHRLSLWSDGSDAANVRNLFPGRVGAVWIPRRKPYNCSFFLYGISETEKSGLEELLSGKTPFPEAPPPALPVKAADDNLKAEDTQEVLLMDAPAEEGEEVSSGVGKAAQGTSPVRLGYFVPDNLPEAGDMIHGVLNHTLKEKKISVHLEKTFSLTYTSLSLGEIQKLLSKCQEESVLRVIALGEPAHMHGLIKMGKDSRIFIKPLSEQVLEKNLWLTMIAELLSYE